MVLKQMPDVLCPWCAGMGGLEVRRAFQAKPVGSYSPAGSSLKFSAVEVPELHCTFCRQSVQGRWDPPGHVVFPDPHSRGE